MVQFTQNGYSESYGYNVFIQDDEEGYYHHFCHLASESLLTIGQTVDRNTIVGIMGATGNVTGPHLHYELMQNSTAFQAENFLDPTTWLGIPNEIRIVQLARLPNIARARTAYTCSEKEKITL